MVEIVWKMFKCVMVLIVCSCGLANMDTMLEGPDVSSNMTTMRGQPKDNITFIWNYNHTEPIHMIIFNRKNEKNGKIERLGVWEDGIFNQNNSRVNERVMFNKTGDLSGAIYLALLNTTARDYNLNYTCRIVFNDRKSSPNISIFLGGGPDVSSNMTNIRGHPKDNITFIWNYNYTIPIYMIIFNRKNENNGKSDRLGIWEDGIFNENNSTVKERVMFNKTGDLEGVIYLTFLNTTVGDYNFNYTCRIVFNDKQSSSNTTIFLAGDPEVYNSKTYVYGRPKTNITLAWRYIYTEPIHKIMFTRTNEKNGKMFPFGLWQNNNFTQMLPEEKQRVMYNKTGDLEGNIYLTLLNTTTGDYNLTYTCIVYFADEQSSSNSTFLFEVTESVKQSGYSNEESTSLSPGVVFGICITVVVVVVVVIIIVYRKVISAISRGVYSLITELK